MTRRDWLLIAGAIRPVVTAVRSVGGEHERHKLMALEMVAGNLALEFARVAATAGMKFDINRFISDCGLDAAHVMAHYQPQAHTYIRESAP